LVASDGGGLRSGLGQAHSGAEDDDRVYRVLSRRICVVTGTRAEFGLLRPLMSRLAADERAELQTLVTGQHLVPALGETWREVETAGFPIDARVDLHFGDDSPLGIARSIARGVEGFAREFERLDPDVLVLLGDRYEILAAAQSATLFGLPIAHLHGGESTEGAIDEAMRHALTKMSHLHFVAAEAYRRRVIQLGEDPARVFTVGAFALDAIADLEPVGLDELSDLVGLDLMARPFVLFTYHPVTLELEAVESATHAVLDALDQVPEVSVLATRANADPSGGLVNRLLEDWANVRSGRVALVASLGHRRYLSAARASAAIVGNSSSGIIEGPALGVQTVNVGSRQRGRLRAPSVLDVPEDSEAIAAALREVLYRPRQHLSPGEHPYGTPGAAKRTASVVLEHPLEGLVHKHFHDLP
jgi:UDP-hydrolysing UDP-N-acetyl-D-glucosamine 2-epimerase